MYDMMLLISGPCAMTSTTTPSPGLGLRGGMLVSFRGRGGARALIGQPFTSSTFFRRPLRWSGHPCGCLRRRDALEGVLAPDCSGIHRRRRRPGLQSRLRQSLGQVHVGLKHRPGRNANKSLTIFNLFEKQRPSAQSHSWTRNGPGQILFKVKPARLGPGLSMLSKLPARLQNEYIPPCAGPC